METQTVDKYGWEIIVKSGGLLDQFTTIGIKKKKIMEGMQGAYTRLPTSMHIEERKENFVENVAEALTWFTQAVPASAESRETPWKDVQEKIDELYIARRKMATTGNVDLNYGKYDTTDWTTQPSWVGVDYSTPNPYIASPSYQSNVWHTWLGTETGTTNQEEEEMSSEQFVRVEFVAVDTQKLEEVVRGTVIAKNSALARTKFIIEHKLDIDDIGEGIVAVIALQSDTFTRYTETVKVEIEV